jgi:hypothetical protein
VDALTAYGVVAVTSMLLLSFLEARAPAFLLAFVAGCVATSVYGFLSGAWPFGVVELLWAGVALRRWRGRVRLDRP